MRQFIIKISYIIFLVLFSSCVTFEEKYFIKEDGSGTFTFTIDYSEYAKVKKGLAEFNTEEEMVNTEFESFVPNLRNVIGISDVKTLQVDSFVESLSFSFSTNGSLNEALCIVHEYPGNSIHTFFRSKGKKLYYNRSNYGTDLSDMSDSESNESREILASMDYNVIIEMEQDIRKIKLKDSRASLASEKNKVIIKTNFYNIDTNNESLDFILKTN